MNPAFSKYTEQNIKKIWYVAPEVRDLFLEFILRIAEEGIYIRIADDGGMRTKEQQKALYDKVPKVTWVQCPYSWHCHGLALDIIPLQKIGPVTFKAVFNKNELYERIAKVALSLNIQWGFKEWGVDKGHFHYTGGKSIEQIIKGSFPARPSFKLNPYNKETVRAINRLKKSGIITDNIFPYLHAQKLASQ